MASQANQALPAGTRLENYRIQRTLASGGFSIVYLAAILLAISLLVNFVAQLIVRRFEFDRTGGS